MVEVIEWYEILVTQRAWMASAEGLQEGFSGHGIWNEMGGFGVVHITAHPSRPKDIYWRSLWLSDRKAEVPMAQQLVSGCETLQEEG